MHFYAEAYSQALGRQIIYRDIPVEEWRDGLLQRGLPVHLVNHLAVAICSSSVASTQSLVSIIAAESTSGAVSV
jgi:hypothetical protein